MISYKQYLVESDEEFTRHVAWGFITINDFDINQGDIYYTDKRGNLSREDGPAFIRKDNSRFWFKDGKVDREDGPAIIWGNGDQFWFKEGNNHRIGGPAVLRDDGHKIWAVYGRTLTDLSSDEDKWLILKGDPDSIKAFPRGSTKEMQEYIIKTRPDLTEKIHNLDPELRKKYKQELNTAGIEI